MTEIELATLLKINPSTLYRWKTSPLGAPFSYKMACELLNQQGKLPNIPEYLKLKKDK